MSGVSLGDDPTEQSPRSRPPASNLKLNIREAGASQSGSPSSHNDFEHTMNEDPETRLLASSPGHEGPSDKSHIPKEMDHTDNLNLDDLESDLLHRPMPKIVVEGQPRSKTASNSSSPKPAPKKTAVSQEEVRKAASLVPVTSEAALGSITRQEDDESSRISAYARLDFENYTFFVQTLQVVLGRKSNDELLQSSHHAVDVHLSSVKAISRRHAKIFYNFGTQRFELLILGRNGAFVDDLFVEKDTTVPLIDGTKIQIGDIPFSFVLPSIDVHEQENYKAAGAKPFNPSDAINLRTNLYSTSPQKDKPRRKRRDSKVTIEEAKASIIRRLSSARRKLLVSNDEISQILSELGSTSLNFDGESGDLDPQIQSILDNHRDLSLDEETNARFARIGESAIDDIEDEEDEIDKLVQQHNFDQGVVLDDEEDDDDDDDLEDDYNDSHDIDMDLLVLDQEIASLAPLINAHNQDLMKEKEERRRELEQEKRRKQLRALKKGAKFPEMSSGGTPYRSLPLMGKPAVPRMGRPATIQPPVNRVYGRHPVNGLPETGLPAHLVALGGPGLPLKLQQGPNSMAHLISANPMAKQMLPSRPPPPKLEVPVNTITSVSVVSSIIPIKAITVNESTIELAPICVTKSLKDPSNVPKIPRKKRDQSIKKLPKNAYALEEIPEQYRTKPTSSYPALISNVLKTRPGNGATIGDIIQGIKDMYPYYKYCPEGWQSIISHNVKLNKVFKQVSEGFDPVFAVDEAYIAEREKVRMKQQELAAARAKAAAIKAEELKQKQRFDALQSVSHNIVGRNFASPYGLPYSSGLRMPQTPFTSQLQKQTNGQKPKTIAELASEIRRDGLVGSKAPLYFKPQGSDVDSPKTPNVGSPGTIKAQLAANRSQSPPPPAQTDGGMNLNTKKSLAYLQKELFTLYKARKLSYNTATTTEIITKALATTIAQVNVIGAKAGCGDNALSFLVEKAPQQVSKILDIALTKSIKEKQGILLSRTGTPEPGSGSVGSELPLKGGTADTETSRAGTLAKPLFNAGLSKPPSFNSGQARPGYASPGLSKPPLFLSNKPVFLSNKKPEDDNGKRPHEEDDEGSASKSIKIE